MSAEVAALAARLRDGLAALPPDSLVVPDGGRIGAVLALLHPGPHGPGLVYTKRRDDLSSHPGQISFPGGRAEPGETVIQAALREAREEVGLDPATVEVLGTLPAFYIPPSRFWLQTVAAVWDDPHPLTPQESEVAEIIEVPLSHLLDRTRWRAVPLTVSGATWAWALDGDRLLWGATAISTAVLLGVLDASWSDGVTPDDLPTDRMVRPWEDADAAAWTPRGARVPGLPEELATPGPARLPRPDAAMCADAAPLVAQAVTGLTRRLDGPVVVLAGPGGTGALGRALVAPLRAAGEDVVVVDAADLRDGLPRPGAVVDALLGRGLEGPLHGRPQVALRLLATQAAPVVAVDLPSGVHPVRGLVGEAASADVTVSLGGPAPGLLAPGVAPFVGDLYRVDLTDRRLVRLLRKPAAWAE